MKLVNALSMLRLGAMTTVVENVMLSCTLLSEMIPSGSLSSSFYMQRRMTHAFTMYVMSS